jgi:XTP/dITP diphosphohydrolase
MELVLATNNSDKIREIKEALQGLPVTILTKEDFENFPDVEETGQTLEENALLKARAIHQFTGMAALADDTGLEVDFLNGAPGVYSSRYAGENASYADNCHKLLAELSGVPQPLRTARFRCVIAIVWEDGSHNLAEGEARGYITEDSVGQGGFGYDPVFYYSHAGKRFSEMSLEEKNGVSHRGLALKAAAYLIRERLAGR